MEDWLLKEVGNTSARGILRGIVLASIYLERPLFLFIPMQFFNVSVHFM